MVTSGTRSRLVAKVVVAAMAMAVFSTLAEDGQSATAWGSSAIVVDVRSEASRTVGQTGIGYSPRWGGVTNAGAYVVLQKVVNGATNTIATLAADAESAYQYTPSDGDGNFVKFIHRVYSSGGEEIGEPLVRDMVFGYRSVEGPAFVADSRTNSLQLAAANRETINLAYSTAWAANAASVAISAIRLSGEGGAATATNSVFMAAADAEGATSPRGIGMGWWRFLCQLKGADGGTLLEYLTEEFRMPGGLLLIIE